MGGDQVKLIAESDFELAVYDIYPAAMEQFTGKARLASSPADAARDADIVQICVRDDAQVNDTLFGENGVVQALVKDKLVVVHSTIKIDTVKEIKSKLDGLGIRFIDAPVSRTRLGEDGRFVFTMIGGDAADADRATPLFNVFSTDVKHIGPIGSAMALKICNNLVTWTQLMVGLQSVRLAAHFGVPVDALIDVMKTNGNLTPSMSGIISSQNSIPRGTSAEFDEFLESQAGIGEKDLDLAIEIGKQASMNMDLAIAAQGMLRPLFARSE
jgi:3-hydroxyisobutyrate dehydrogenase